MATAREFPPLLMPAPAAAHYLGLSESTLRTLELPRRVVGAKRLYDRRDLDRWADGLPYEGEALQDGW
ncbi:helix-turn-helix domain-containing protein [Roseovarius sp. SK2]|uniref:helix-turn-helix domain-containing protein n=1 Tax=Roseovarius TaxID=74030 RepID=UPI00237BEFC2|nr:helix-turn-helix domain-containing protein [Roseovarius sp. SK2]MDD9727189.1 helix-turn-helix domain-containing protein [Roseovarius sp. SK2]